VLFSYAGKLCWGFTADWDLVPDLHQVVVATEAAYAELRDAAAAATPVTEGAEARRPPRRARRRGQAPARAEGA